MCESQLAAQNVSGETPFIVLLSGCWKKTRFCGATIIRGAGGFGSHARFHADRLLSLITNLPIIIEFVDYGERIHDLLPKFDDMIKKGMITVEEVDVIFYRDSLLKESK